MKKVKEKQEGHTSKAGILMAEIDAIFTKNGLKPPVYKKKTEGYFCFTKARKQGENK